MEECVRSHTSMRPACGITANQFHHQTGDTTSAVSLAELPEAQVSDAGLPLRSVAELSNLMCTECAVAVLSAGGTATLNPCLPLSPRNVPTSARVRLAFTVKISVLPS